MEAALEEKLYGPPLGAVANVRPMLDPAYIHTERSRPGVTLELLHLEYLEKHPDGYRYTQFCEIYRRWAKQRRLSMRQVHHAGEKLFVDYSGKKPAIVDQKTGEVIEGELFVAVWAIVTKAAASPFADELSSPFANEDARCDRVSADEGRNHGGVGNT